ncbi:MAG: nitrate- and nitrite sensing domain-containing protein, partial [Comamonadaceae bacterium]
MNGLLGRLIIWQKLAIFGLLGIAVALPPTVMYLLTSNAGIRAAQTESAGIEPSRALLRVIQYTQQHRGMSAGFLGGNASMAGQREQTQVQVDKLIGEAGTILGHDIKQAKIVANWTKATQNWKSLAQDVAQKSITGAQSFARHTALVAEYLVVVDQTADEFGLSLDPDADSYFLINAVLVHLPNLTESLGQARARGARFLAQKEITQEDRADLSSLIRLTKFHAQNMKVVLGKVVELNPAIKAALAEPMKHSEAAVETAIRLAEEQVIRPDKLSFDSAEFFKIYTGVIDTLFALNTRAMTELSDMTHGRESRLRNFQYSMLGLIALITLIATAVGYAITRSITQPMGEAVLLAQRVAAGDLSATVEVKSRDEIGMLLQALKDMNENLKKIVGEVRRGTEAIGSGTKEIASGNADLSQRTEQQASSLEETASSMEELTSTVKQNAENAKQANQLALGASAVAVKGGAVVSEV